MNCHCCSDVEYRKVGETHHCPNCKHRYYAYPDSIKYHTEQYRKSSVSSRVPGEFKDGKPTGAFHAARKKIVRERVVRLAPWLMIGDSLLDIGSGAGTFARDVRTRVISVECLELDPCLVEECRRLGFRTYDEDFMKQEFTKTYDVVTCWHVLEHIDNVVEFMEKLRDLTDVVAFIEVPINRGFPRINPFDGHLHMFCETSFKALLTKVFGRVWIDIKEGIQTPSLLAMVTK